MCAKQSRRRPNFPAERTISGQFTRATNREGREGLKLSNLSVRLPPHSQPDTRTPSLLFNRLTHNPTVSGASPAAPLRCSSAHSPGPSAPPGPHPAAFALPARPRLRLARPPRFSGRPAPASSSQSRSESGHSLCAEAARGVSARRTASGLPLAARPCPP